MATKRAKESAASAPMSDPRPLIVEFVGLVGSSLPDLTVEMPPLPILYDLMSMDDIRMAIKKAIHDSEPHRQAAEASQIGLSGPYVDGIFLLDASGVVPPTHNFGITPAAWKDISRARVVSTKAFEAAWIAEFPGRKRFPHGRFSLANDADFYNPVWFFTADQQKEWTRLKMLTGCDEKHTSLPEAEPVTVLFIDSFKQASLRTATMEQLGKLLLKKVGASNDEPAFVHQPLTGGTSNTYYCHPGVGSIDINSLGLPVASHFAPRSYVVFL